MGLAWSPYWLGGNRPLAWGVNGVVFPILALVYEMRVLLTGRAHPVAISHIAGPAALFCAVLVWAAVQGAARSPAALAHPIWGMAAEALSRPLPASISVNRSETAIAVTRLFTAASVFWLALELSRDSARAHLLLTGVAVIVALYSIFGLLLAALFSGAIPFFSTPYAPGLVRSTFVNRNSFATYAGLGVVASVGLLLRRYRVERASNPIDDRDRVVVNWRILAPGAFGVVAFVALLGAASRGGALALGAGLMTLFALLFLRRRRGRAQGAAMALVALALALGFFMFSDHLLERITNGGFGDAGRLTVDLIVARSILDNPLLGVGYGTFADVFPLYRDLSIPTAGVWDKAHNTYLEVLLGLGVPMGLALIGALAWLAGKCVVGAVRRRRDATPPLVAAAASALVGVHALVDFSVQIEGVCLTYVAILGAGVAQAQSGRRDLSDRCVAPI